MLQKQPFQNGETPTKTADELIWRAMYEDGTSLWECNSEGIITNHQKQIDRTQLMEFRIYQTGHILAAPTLKNRLENCSGKLGELGVTVFQFTTWLHAQIGKDFKWVGITYDSLFKFMTDLAENKPLVDMIKTISPPKKRGKGKGESEKETDLYQMILSLIKPIVTVTIPRGGRLIFRRRRLQKVQGPQTPFATIYLVGWQMTLKDADGKDKNVQSILYLYPDGSIVLGGTKANDEIDVKLLNFDLVRRE